MAIAILPPVKKLSHIWLLIPVVFLKYNSILYSSFSYFQYLLRLRLHPFPIWKSPSIKLPCLTFTIGTPQHPTVCYKYNATKRQGSIIFKNACFHQFQSFINMLFAHSPLEGCEQVYTEPSIHSLGL